jgi:sulfatase maturation enzyme AslB (radical SAM superfamily)
MKLISIQEAYKRKLNRQTNITGLEFHASGHCVHVGKISPGCIKCFVPWISMNFHIGTNCNCNCPYCYGVAGSEDLSGLSSHRKYQIFTKIIKANNFNVYPIVSFTGGDVILDHLHR